MSIESISFLFILTVETNAVDSGWSVFAVPSMENNDTGSFHMVRRIQLSLVFRTSATFINDRRNSSHHRNS